MVSDSSRNVVETHKKNNGVVVMNESSQAIGAMKRGSSAIPDKNFEEFKSPKPKSEDRKSKENLSKRSHKKSSRQSRL